MPLHVFYDWEACMDALPAGLSEIGAPLLGGQNNYFMVKDHWIVVPSGPVPDPPGRCLDSTMPPTVCAAVREWFAPIKSDQQLGRDAKVALETQGGIGGVRCAPYRRA